MELASDLDTERLRVAQLTTGPSAQTKGNPPVELAMLTETEGNPPVELATPTERIDSQEIQTKV